MKQVLIGTVLAIGLALMPKAMSGVEFSACPTGTVLDPNASEPACMVDSAECRGGINEANQEDCSTNIVVSQ